MTNVLRCPGHQADFISAVFESWDEHYDQIKLIFYFMIHDWSQEFVDELAIYYGLEGNVAFTEYLRTLGLRTFSVDGTDKLGMERFRCEADARGFCDAECSTGTQNLTGLNWKVYPNPASESVHVESTKDGIVSVYNVVGGLAMRYRINKGSNLILLPELPTGIYLMQLANKTGVAKSFPLEIR